MLASACSTHQQADEAPIEDPAASSEEAPLAETDAAPPTPSEDGQAIAAAGTTSNDSANDPKEKPAPRKKARSAARKPVAPVETAQTEAPAPIESEPEQTMAAAQPETVNPPPITEPAAPVAAMNQQISNPETAEPARTPASPTNPPAPASVEDPELNGESSGGLMETLMAYRAAIMAALGVILAGAGGLAFWKKKQAAV